MELTGSWTTALPTAVAERYELRETRNAAAVLAATCADEVTELCAVLTGFTLTTADLVEAGGNESRLAARLNTAFRERGWREGRVDTVVTSRLQVQPWHPAGEHGVTVRESEVFNEGYKVDNVKGRVALDVEWNAKDGNLDRDIGAYRALYDAGLIDGAVLLTRTHDDLRELARELARAAGRSDDEVRSRLSTSTTTHLGKLESRMTRGDAGGCPLLAVAISRRCWDPAPGEPARAPAPAPLMLTDEYVP
ncbi:BglII/BstYI family type II restriction endonuclease [Actinomycetospora callitridis]|uniref:BglII/BstYI family type II restriction endonuclease n=1 Tax=Actinomycetospora callitridis TaxID=913944 RepID=UPI0023673F97|nr:BglII/BstYI family type II restriction endonuclease [Actinomycetospora callitridis]MDD7920419.1 BglII/BstYI family type II restriction endonuclease [Actinomycetospora callitridis]